MRHLIAAFLLLTAPATAAEITLKVHHFLPPTTTVQVELIEPWARAVEEQSGGRIEVQIYPAMQLGGKPPQLFDQARDGVVDISWTLLGYTPGRFPRAEVFELPFIASTAAATNAALQDYQAKYLTDELAEVHPLLLHVGAPGKFHFKRGPVASLDDLRGLKLRGPSRAMTDALNAMEAVAVGMPVPELPLALTTGVIDGALVPWEVTRDLKLTEITKYHTEFDGENGLYTSVFALVMNRAKYDNLPPDLREIIDRNAGAALAAQASAVYDGIEADIRQQALDHGAEITVIATEDQAPWRAAAQPVIDAWVAARDAAGDDGMAMLNDARAMIAAHQP
ncbi:MAG: TRAP transporter substrate-binding protein [Paracoccus sp. (in: a-proteobacteria)]|uniref:TRAP transporter substrate-binding protein n=1 Tax=Paracoccus sp. TaxID=267 RepID=UPI0026E05490|nr:TRAP transporter substrate-binding protein [Paracoccus sp. (in: a-proteobacteria)]MDO5622586.1 TRAP transporter substrate-binding protein [Paracoccus sp. (in: a-proteobacteria)]